MIGVGVLVLAVVACCVVSYMALAMAGDPASKTRTIGVSFGVMGFLLMLLVVFWPLFVIRQTFGGDAEGIPSLFSLLVIGAACCSIGSMATIVAARWNKIIDG